MATAIAAEGAAAAADAHEAEVPLGAASVVTAALASAAALAAAPAPASAAAAAVAPAAAAVPAAPAVPAAASARTGQPALKWLQVVRAHPQPPTPLPTLTPAPTVLLTRWRTRRAR